MQSNYELTYKEKQDIIRWKQTEVDMHMLDIDSAIKELKKLKKSGAKYIALARDEENETKIHVMGCKEELETDEEQNERIALHEDSKKREHEKDLIEYSRLKGKLNL